MSSALTWVVRCIEDRGSKERAEAGNQKHGLQADFMSAQEPWKEDFPGFMPGKAAGGCGKSRDGEPKEVDGVQIICISFWGQQEATRRFISGK